MIDFHFIVAAEVVDLSFPHEERLLRPEFPLALIAVRAAWAALAGDFNPRADDWIWLPAFHLFTAPSPKPVAS